MNPLAWREAAAVADMHSRLAAKKLNAVMTKDTKDTEGQMRELEKAVECIEAAHEAAMRAYNEMVFLTRRAKSVKGVRLTSIRETLKVAIGEQTGESK